jgi:hypothetical protein
MLMLVNDHLGERVVVTTRAAGEVIVAELRGVLQHVSPDQQYDDVEAVLGQQPEREPGDLMFRHERGDYEEDVGVYAVGDGGSGIDLSQLWDGVAEAMDQDVGLVIALDEHAYLEILWIDRVKPLGEDDE